MKLLYTVFITMACIWHVGHSADNQATLRPDKQLLLSSDGLSTHLIDVASDSKSGNAILAYMRYGAASNRPEAEVHISLINPQCQVINDKTFKLASGYSYSQTIQDTVFLALSSGSYFLSYIDNNKFYVHKIHLIGEAISEVYSQAFEIKIPSFQPRYVSYSNDHVSISGNSGKRAFLLYADLASEDAVLRDMQIDDTSMVPLFHVSLGDDSYFIGARGSVDSRLYLLNMRLGSLSIASIDIPRIVIRSYSEYMGRHIVTWGSNLNPEFIEIAEIKIPQIATKLVEDVAHFNLKDWSTQLVGVFPAGGDVVGPNPSLSKVIPLIVKNHLAVLKRERVDLALLDLQQEANDRTIQLDQAVGFRGNMKVAQALSGGVYIAGSFFPYNSADKYTHSGVFVTYVSSDSISFYK